MKKGLLTIGFMSLALFQTAEANQCANAIDFVNISASMNDSSGEARSGVIINGEADATASAFFVSAMYMIPNQDLENQRAEALAAAENGTEAPNTAIIDHILSLDYNTRTNPEFQDQIKSELLSASYCLTQEGPKSDYVHFFKNQNCIEVNSVVGLRLDAQVWSPNSSIQIESIEIDGTRVTGNLEIFATGTNDICLQEAPNNARVVTIKAKSTGNEGSRPNLSVQLLTGED